MSIQFVLLKGLKGRADCYVRLVDAVKIFRQDVLNMAAEEVEFRLDNLKIFVGHIWHDFLDLLCDNSYCNGMKTLVKRKDLPATRFMVGFRAWQMRNLFQPPKPRSSWVLPVS